MVQVANGEWLRKDLEAIRGEITSLRADINKRFDQIEVRLDAHSLKAQDHENRISDLEEDRNLSRSNKWNALMAIIAMLGAVLAWLRGGQ